MDVSITTIDPNVAGFIFNNFSPFYEIDVPIIEEVFQYPYYLSKI